MSIVPSTIPPELYFINQFITRGKYTITTVLSENGPPPSELKLARRIGFALLQIIYNSNAVPKLATCNLQFATYTLNASAFRNFAF